MKDRVSTKILDNGATRYGVYDETGKLLRYEYIKLEDEPDEEGTILNKANLLTDEVARQVGLRTADPTPNDMFNVLAHVGNMHVWERVLTTIDASYVERRVNISDANIFSSNYQSSTYYARFNVSDSINITSSGDISLVSPTQVEIYFQSGALYNFDSLKGKYILYASTASNSSSSFPGSGKIGYISSDAEVSVTHSNNYQAKITSGASEVYSVFVPAETTTDYLISTDRNAYPPAHYTLADEVTVDVLSSGANYSAYVNSCDLNSIVVNNDGSIPTAQFSSDSGGSNILTLAGSWYKFYPTKAYYITSDASNVVFTDTIFTVSAETTLQYADGKYVLPGCRELIGHATVEAIPSNATITYLGQLGGGARIEVGSYVGTGTYGSLNPITLTFVGIPKLVIVECEQGSVNAHSNGLGVFFYGQKIAQVHLNLKGSGSSNANVVLSWNQNAVSWYGNDSSAHLNDENTTYHYIAIG